MKAISKYQQYFQRTKINNFKILCGTTKDSDSQRDLEKKKNKVGGIMLFAFKLPTKLQLSKQTSTDTKTGTSINGSQK